MRKSCLIIAAFMSCIGLVGCGSANTASDSFSPNISSESDSAETGSRVSPELEGSGTKESGGASLPYAAAYDYKTGEAYDFCADMYASDGRSAEKRIAFQGQALNARMSFRDNGSSESSYGVEGADILVEGDDGAFRFKGIAFYRDFYWVLRPLYEESDDALPLLGEFSGDERAQIDKLSSITVGGKEYKTHPFDIVYLALGEEYTKELMPDFSADEGRVYMVEGEAEYIVFASGYSGFSNTELNNMVLSAEDIGAA